MHNISMHKLQYYQIQQMPSMVLTALVTWYTCNELAHYKILQNFLFTLVLSVHLILSKLKHIFIVLQFYFLLVYICL